MALVGRLVFCTACGNLLDRRPATQKEIKCDVCETMNLISHSKPDAFPSSLRNKKSGFGDAAPENFDTWASMNYTCPNCDNPEMRYRDIQLRSADEGTTVFYHYPKCSYKFNTNN